MVESYWTALRGARRAPARSDIDPVRIEDALDYAFILEHVAPGIFRFRLAGAHLNELMGMEVRGMPITAMFSPSSRMIASQQIERVFRDTKPKEMRLASLADPQNAHLDAQLLLLPLQSDSGQINRALGVLEARGCIGTAPRRFDLAATAATKSTLSQLVDEDRIPEFAEPAVPFDHGTKKPDDMRPALRLVWNGDDPV